MKKAICFGMGLLALAGGASFAAARVPAPASAGTLGVTAPWSIAGVTLGMPPAEVGAALKLAGYVLEFRSEGRSWQGEVANQVSSLRGIRIPQGVEVVRKEEYRKGQEQVQVIYDPAPTGAYVARVDYKIAHEAIDEPRFMAAARAKYGRPTRMFGNEHLYCMPLKRECDRTGSLDTNQLPNLTVYGVWVSGRTLRLVQGERADKAFNAAVRAEAERLYPKKDKPTF